jgi:hypothetical protein
MEKYKLELLHSFASNHGYKLFIEYSSGKMKYHLVNKDTNVCEQESFSRDDIIEKLREVSFNALQTLIQNYILGTGEIAFSELCKNKE